MLSLSYNLKQNADGSWQLSVSGQNAHVNGTKVISDNNYKDNVLVIDTDKIYIFFDKEGELKEVFELDNIKSKDDIIAVRAVIINLLN